MKERPILFSGAMVRAILEGRKTMTRRVVKPQFESDFWIIRLTDDRLYGWLYTNTKERSVEYEPCRDYGERVWRCVAGDSFFPQCGLPGWIGRTSVLPHAVLRLWEKGARGLVSVERACRSEGIQEREHVSQQYKGDATCPQADLRGISRTARKGFNANEASGRESKQQCSRKSCMGNAGGKLAGPQDARPRDEWRESPDVKVERRGEGAHQVVCCKRNRQPETYSACDWNEPSCNIRSVPWQLGQHLWVRETFAYRESAPYADGKSDLLIQYAADGEICNIHREFPSAMARAIHDNKPSIYMPRWASRILLEVVSVRVERVQEIGEADAVAEGMSSNPMRLFHEGIMPRSIDFRIPMPIQRFIGTWNAINYKRGFGWYENPWAWVIEFKRVEP